MSKPINNVAVEIGETLRKARLDRGYESRASLVETRKLRGKIGSEGLRKIEAGERIPRLENLRILGEALGLPERKIKELEKKALVVNVERQVRKAGNVNATVHITGTPVRVEALPPRRKVEAYARKTVNDLIVLADRMGWFQIEQDREWFRRHARSTLLRNLNPELEGT